MAGLFNYPAGSVQAKGVRFVEDGAGTYTGEIELPAGAVILDIVVHAEALWAAGTSASLEVGDDADPDGFFTAVDLKATDLLADESISFAQSGGAAGAYNAGTNTHWTDRYSSSARTITATVASVGAGTTGRTQVLVFFVAPNLVEVTQ